MPDDYTACSGYMPVLPSAGGGSSEGGAAGESGARGTTPAAGLGGNMSATLPEDAGAGGTSGAGATSGAAGAAGAGGAAGAVPSNPQAGAAGSAEIPSPRFGCQVQRAASDPAAVTAQCSPVGTGGGNAPCLTSSDCQAGFGCVGDQSSGLCQRYCCHDADACEADTYCAERPLRDALINEQGSAVTALSIPVCVPAENCDLSTVYPCLSGKQCACSSGTACLVVRSDGTTTCAIPGKGKAGDACPCAWNYVCSAATNQCLELCYTRDATACGDAGKCQSATELPEGWGVCIGG